MATLDHLRLRPEQQDDLGRWRGRRGVVFDLDGVITRTASVHFAAWKALFDPPLAADAARRGLPFRPFDTDDYLRHVDGKPRDDGVRDLLASRGIACDTQVVRDLGGRKNELFRALLDRDGVAVYPGATALLADLRRAGVRTALVSSSKNTRLVLRKTGLADLFDVVLDGLDAEAAGLAGKPAPDTFLAAARMLDLAPEDCAVLEDAVAGIRAGAAGGFGLVVGVDRGAGRDALTAAGAHVVVGELEELR